MSLKVLSSERYRSNIWFDWLGDTDALRYFTKIEPVYRRDGWYKTPTMCWFEYRGVAITSGFMAEEFDNELHILNIEQFTEREKAACVTLMHMPNLRKLLRNMLSDFLYSKELKRITYTTRLSVRYVFDNHETEDYGEMLPEMPIPANWKAESSFIQVIDNCQASNVKEKYICSS